MRRDRSNITDLARTFAVNAQSSLWTLIFFLLCSTINLHAQSILPSSDAKSLASMRLLLCFQGKGSCLPYDGGVLHELYGRVPALRDGQTIVTGNSSGSIPAAFFCCYGFSDATVQHAEERMRMGNRDAVRGMESISNKLSKLLQGQRSELPHSDLREYIAFALGVSNWQDAKTIDEVVRRSSAIPRFPCLIVACNKEVLEDRNPIDDSLPGQLKEIDLDNLQVSWRPNVYEFYRSHPDRFQRDHPHLKLGSTRRIGRALTYFVDPSLFALLSQIPDEERLADLRLMTTAADVALGIMASTSEPTYFDPIQDPQTSKILVSANQHIDELVNSRTYYGGFLLPMPAQDIRRMLPGIYSFGTGWRHMPYIARRFLRNSLLADCEEVSMRHDWWADVEINPDEEVEEHFVLHDLNTDQEFAFGVARTKHVLEFGDGVPLFVKQPKFHQAADNAVKPRFNSEEMFEPDGKSGSAKLKTMRGIKQLINSGKL